MYIRVQILPRKVSEFVERGTKHQIRIYPKGTRIRPNNYNPVPEVPKYVHRIGNASIKVCSSRVLY
jgi:hypothetical protein